MNTDAPGESALYWAERRVLEIQTKLHKWASDDPHRRFDDLFNQPQPAHQPDRPARARSLTLDLLTAREARALLARHLGPDRISAEPHAVADLIDRCARLPLALSIVAARAGTHPGFELRVLAKELADEHTRLDALNTGEPTTSVRAVFSWSYHQLSIPAARMFRLLGLHPGPDIHPLAAAQLADLSDHQTREALSELSRARLLTQYLPGRYTFHDLLRAYATHLATTFRV